MRKRWIAVFALMLTAVTWGCGGGGGSSSGSAGTLSVGLVDATSPRYKAVYVTITDVQVHQPGTNESNARNWTSLDMPRSPMTVNLLELVNGVREDLGLVDLNAGAYTQMRLVIGNQAERPPAINILSEAHPYANYVIDLNDASHELKVPSGSQSGFKVVGGFDINTGRTTELVLDFDANRSVVEAGNSGQWLLKPTVKIDMVEEAWIIRGVVKDGAGLGVPGAVVSVQVYDASAAPADQVTIKASTVTESGDPAHIGEYELLVQQLPYQDDVTLRQVSAYNLVAYAPYFPVPAAITITDADDADGDGVISGKNFVIPGASNAGQFNISVGAINTGAEDRYATLSFRRPGPNTTQIEVDSINLVENTTGHLFRITAGTYTVVASTTGQTSLVSSETATTGSAADLAINFP